MVFWASSLADLHLCRFQLSNILLVAPVRGAACQGRRCQGLVSWKVTIGLAWVVHTASRALEMLVLGPRGRAPHESIGRVNALCLSRAILTAGQTHGHDNCTTYLYICTWNLSACRAIFLCFASHLTYTQGAAPRPQPP